MIGVFRLGASDRLRRLDEIDRLGMSHSKEGGRERYFAKMRDDETVYLWEHDRDALLRRPLQLLPAEPGWSVIRVSDQADEPWTWREPIVGWALCFDGEIRPVAPNGIPDDSKRFTYVEMPGGRIEGVGDNADPASFKDAAEMAAYRAGAKTEALDG
jgi:hypothetical protein